MKKTLLIFCFILAQCAVFAQDGLLQGTIIDNGNGEPLPFADISVDVDGRILGTSSEMDGSYSLSLPAGVHTVNYSFAGYKDEVRSVTILADEALVLNLQMSENQEVLQTVVVSGSKFERPMAEETVSIEVLKPDVIENSNLTSGDGVLEKVPGVTVIDGQANIRGGSGYSYGAGSRVMLLVDGLPILTGDAGYPAWDFVPIESIAQVEVIKGASSALYGSAALNGIVNIRTAYPTSEPYTKVTNFLGFYEKPRDNEYIVRNADGVPTDTLEKAWWGEQVPFQAGVSFGHRQKFGQFDLVLGGYAYGYDSWRKEQFSRRARFNANTRYRFAKAPITMGINFNGQIKRSGSFFVWGDGGNAFAPLNPQDYYKPWNQVETPINKQNEINIDPFIEHYDVVRGIRQKLMARLYVRDVTNQTEQGSSNVQVYGEYQFQKRFEESDLTITSGIVGQASETEATLYADFVTDENGDTIAKAPYNANNGAFYLQVDKRLMDKLSLAFGARYEVNTIEDEQDSKPVFRAGLNYQLAKATYLRASYGQGYRFPTIAEKFVDTSIGLFGVKANPDLEPETGWSGELGIKQGVRLFGWEGYLDVSGFLNEYQNMMEFTAIVGGFESQNIGDTRITGVELSLMGRGEFMGFPVNLIGGYTYINPRLLSNLDSIRANAPLSLPSGPFLDDKGDDYLKYRNSHNLKMDAQVQVLNRLELGGSVNYLSYMHAIDSLFSALLPYVGKYRREHTDGTVIVQARAQYHVSPNSTLSLVVDNLLNQEYTVRPAMIEAPRTWTVKYLFEIGGNMPPKYTANY